MIFWVEHKETKKQYDVVAIIPEGRDGCEVDGEKFGLHMSHFLLADMGGAMIWCTSVGMVKNFNRITRRGPGIRHNK